MFNLLFGSYFTSMNAISVVERSFTTTFVNLSYHTCFLTLVFVRPISLQSFEKLPTSDQNQIRRVLDSCLFSLTLLSVFLFCLHGIYLRKEKSIPHIKLPQSGLDYLYRGWDEIFCLSIFLEAHN